MTRFLFAALLLIAAAASWAQTSIPLTFPNASPRSLWVASEPPTGEPDGAILTEAAQFEFKAPSFGAHDQLFVWDQRTGNLAFAPLNVAAKGWTLKDADFRYAMRVAVRIEHAGKPVATASVNLKDGRQDVAQLLDNSMRGVVVFWAVKPGPVKLEVTFASKGKTLDPVKQTVELSLQRQKAIPVFVVSIPDEVATLDVPFADPSGNDDAATRASGATGAAGTSAAAGSSGSNATPGAPPRGNDTTNPLGRVMSILMSLAIAIAIVYFGLKWLRANEKTVQSKLEAMGVQVPKAPDVDAGATALHTPVVAPPIEKIMLDGADPGAPVAVGPPRAFQPRLVDGSSTSFSLNEGASVVSRESGEIVLAGNATVSRRHAVITRDGDAVRVRDEGSSNGTFVNGRKIDVETTLAIGDTVQFGSAAFRFEG